MRAALLAMALLALAASAARAEAPLAAGVIDARPTGTPPDPARAAAAAALAKRAELRVPLDPALAAALVGGAPPDARRTRALAATDAAAAAYAELRCDAVPAASTEAALAWLAAAPLAEARAPLERLLVFALLCADQRGDAPAFAAAGARLRALGHAAAPPGVGPATWQRVPDVDATANAGLTLVALTATPPGAQVWVDLRPIGPAPAQIALGEGPHWVHVEGPDGARAALTVDVATRDRRLSVTLEATSEKEDKRWKSLRERVVAWQRGGAVDERSVAQAMRDAGLVLMVVLVLDDTGQTRAELWRMAATATTPTRLARVEATPDALDPMLAAALAPGRDAPLPPKSDASDEGLWSKTWPYVALGALAVGIGVIWAVSTGDTVQRVEVHFP